jgi:hypothetical protein
MNQPTAIIVKNHEGTPVCDKGEILGHHTFNEDGSIKDFVSLVLPCPSIANTDPGKTVMAELRWQYKSSIHSPEWIDETDIGHIESIKRDIPTRQIWVPIVEQKEGEGKFGEWMSVEKYVFTGEDDFDYSEPMLLGHETDKWVVRGVYQHGDWYNDFDTETPCYPTHFMPLPPAPITEK